MWYGNYLGILYMYRQIYVLYISDHNLSIFLHMCMHSFIFFFSKVSEVEHPYNGCIHWIPEKEISMGYWNEGQKIQICVVTSAWVFYHYENSIEQMIKLWNMGRLALARWCAIEITVRCWTRMCKLFTVSWGDRGFIL